MVPSLLLLLVQPTSITGQVVTPSGAPLAGIVVGAAPAGASFRHATATDRQGRFSIATVADRPHRLTVGDGRYQADGVDVRPGQAAVRLVANAAAQPLATSQRWLATLPDGADKRWFILDCTGCHQLNETRALVQGAARSPERWTTDAARMLANFGPQSGFPIISGGSTPEALASWVTRYLRDQPRPAPPPATVASDYTLTEYDLPGQDLPHDIAVDSAGRVVITAMFRHHLMVLDKITGTTETVAIPVPNANPRAIEVDAAGRWWVLLGQPQTAARYDPTAKAWRTADVAMYGHSIGIGPDGRAWTNNHFERGGVRLARIEDRDGSLGVTSFSGAVESAARGPSGIPYELRIAPNGVVWVSLLHGNALVAFDPKAEAFTNYPMPDAVTGPRRFDIDRSGALWIPGYASSALYRLDPATRRFTTHRLPLPNALPYVARVHPTTGDIWIGTAAPDLIYRFSPKTNHFTAYPVLTRGATMRHLVIDAKRGDIWVAYGASPAIHPTRVARLTIR